MRGKKNNPFQQANKRNAGSLRSEVSIIDRLGPEQVFDRLYNTLTFQTMKEWLVEDLDGKKDLSISWMHAERYDYQIRMLTVLPEERTIKRLGYWLEPLLDALINTIPPAIVPKEFYDIHITVKTTLSGKKISIDDWDNLNEKIGQLEHKFSNSNYGLSSLPGYTREQFSQFHFLARAYHELLFNSYHIPSKQLKGKTPWINLRKPLDNAEMEQLGNRVWTACRSLDHMRTSANKYNSFKRVLAKDLIKTKPNPFERAALQK